MGRKFKNTCFLFFEAMIFLRDKRQVKCLFHALKVLLFILLLFFDVSAHQNSELNREKPKKENKAVAVDEVEEDSIFYNFSTETRKQFLKSVASADEKSFKLVKEIVVREGTIHFTIIESVRTLMRNHLDFFLSNINDMSREQIQHLFVDDFIDMDDSLNSYYFYQIILKKLKKVSVKERNSLNKVRGVIQKRVQEKTFISNYKSVLAAEKFKKQFCKSFFAGVDEFIDYVSGNEKEVYKYIVESNNSLDLICYGWRKNFRDITSDVFVYGNYMIVSLSRTKKLNGKKKQVVEKIIKDLRKGVEHTYYSLLKDGSNLYKTMLESFFSNQAFFVENLSGYTAISDSVARDIAEVIKCKKPKVDYKKLLNSLNKLNKKEQSKNLKKFASKLRYYCEKYKFSCKNK